MIPGPDEPGGQTHIFGGQESLRQMDRFDIVLPVIVVTQFEAFVAPNTILLADLIASLSRAQCIGLGRRVLSLRNTRLEGTVEGINQHVDDG